MQMHAVRLKRNVNNFRQMHLNLMYILLCSNNGNSIYEKKDNNNQKEKFQISQ